MPSITTTTFSSAIATKWLRDLVKTAEGYLMADKFASLQPMKRGEGGTLVYNRILRPSLVTAASTAGVSGMVAPASAKALYSNKLEVSPSLFQDVFAIDDNAGIQSFIGNDQIKKTIANQMAISLDYQVMKMLATQGMRHRIDGDATYQQSSATVTAGATTTYAAYSALTGADDVWNGGYLSVTNPDGTNYDYPARKISDWDLTGGTVETMATHAAFPVACDVSSKIRAVSSDGIVATDILTTTGLFDVMGLHAKLETEKFEDGYFRGFFDPAQYRDLWKDSVFLAAAEYDSGGTGGTLKGYQLARWAGLELIISSNVYREDVDGVEFGHGGAGTTGVCYASPIIGKNSYALTPWGQGEGKFGLEWHIVDKADSQNLLNNASFIGWKTYWGGSVLRSTSDIVLLTGATSQAILV